MTAPLTVGVDLGASGAVVGLLGVLLGPGQLGHAHQDLDASDAKGAPGHGVDAGAVALLRPAQLLAQDGDGAVGVVGVDCSSGSGSRTAVVGSTAVWRAWMRNKRLSWR